MTGARSLDEQLGRYSAGTGEGEASESRSSRNLAWFEAYRLPLKMVPKGLVN